MKWTGRQGSGNVEDRRGMGGKVAIGGIGGVIIVILTLIFGNPEDVDLNNLSQFENTQPTNGQQYEEEAQFVSVVLKDTEDVWHALLDQNGQQYVEPTLVLFSNSTDSGCGFASSATGPFYCPPDSKVYIDLSFYDELQNRFGAGGDFAMAYVIAHEVGHHVQHLLGTTDQVQQENQNLSEEERNALSVRVELQADFYAGVWAHHAQQMKNILEPGDIEEALNAANAIGDDRLQMQSQGYVVPDAFTHGTSAQRMHWFKKGFETGDLNQGNTFKNLE